MKTLNDFAQEYVDLMLSKIAHDHWDIYSYIEFPKGKRMTQPDRSVTDYNYAPPPKTVKRTLDEIKLAAERLEQEIYAYSLSESSNENQRLEYLQKHIRCLRVRIERLQGKKLPFNQMTKLYYDIQAPEYDEALFEKMLADLDAVLPGQGALADRLDSFRQQLIIPADRLPIVMNAAADVFHGCSVQHLGTWPGGRPKLTFTALGAGREGISIDGYLNEWDMDRMEWEIIFNLDHAYSIEDAMNYGCHELEPGHLTYIALRARTAYEKNYPELAIVSQYGPSSPLIEGAARVAIDMCMHGDEVLDFERGTLFPLAGIDKGLMECMPAWHNYCRYANYAKLTLDRNIWDGVWSREQGISWMKKYLLTPQGAEERTLDHLAADDGHFVAHDYSRDIIARYIYGEAGDKSQRWALYKKLFTNHVSMCELEAGTYKPLN